MSNSTSGGVSGLIAIEAQLVGAAQRHLQVRHGRLVCRRGDGWALFSFEAITKPEEAAQLGKDVQRLCNALVRDVTGSSGQTAIRLAGESAEANFGGINDGAVALSKMIGACADVGADAGRVVGAQATGSSDGGDAAALRNVLEMLYTDVATDANEGVHGVTDFPALMCPTGRRFDVVLQRAVCVKAFSDCKLDDAVIINGGRGAASMTGALSGAKGVLGDDDDADDDDGNGGAGGGTIALNGAEHGTMKDSFTLQNSSSGATFAKDTAQGKIWIDTATIAHAIAFYSSVSIEKELPGLWRAKAFSLREAGDVLQQVYCRLRNYWNRHGDAAATRGATGSSSSPTSSERMRINALSLLSIVSGDLREYVRAQLAVAGAGWRGPWRAPLEDLQAAVELFKDWLKMTTQLTKGGEWVGWDGETFHDESFEQLAARLRDAARVRATIAEASALAEDGRLPDALSPELLFDRCGVFDSHARGEWARRTERFDKEMSFLEPQLRNRVRAVITAVPPSDSQVRLVVQNRALLRREGIRSAVEKDLDATAAFLKQQLDTIKARFDNGCRRATTSTQKLRVVRGCEAECEFVPTVAYRAFGQSAQFDAVAEHAKTVLATMAEQEKAVLAEWVKLTESAAQKIVKLEDAVVIQHSTVEGLEGEELDQLTCKIHPNLQQFVQDVYTVCGWMESATAAAASDGSSTALTMDALSDATRNTFRACESLRTAAMRTQQSTANFNTVMRQVLPCTRSMLEPAVQRALSHILPADTSASTRTISLANFQELEGLNLRFQNVVESLSNENRQIRIFHADFTTQVLALLNVDLTRRMDHWRATVDNMRSSFDEFLSKHHLKDYDEWRRHWDCQIYKALEHQYRKGLESLHENMEAFQVELVFKQGVVQFKPSFEAIREAYYIKLREFVSVPLRFRGLQPKRADSSESYEIYPEMPGCNSHHIVTVHTKAVELFGKLHRVRRAFRAHLTVGLCGANGAPDLDSIVARWAACSAEAAAKEKKDNAGQRAGAHSRLDYYADGLRIVKDHAAKLNKIDDVMKLDCFAISTVPLKVTIEEQLHRLEESVLNAMRQHIQSSLNSIDEFVFNASNVVERQPTTMNEVGLANKAYRECAAELKGYEERLDEVEAQNKELRAYAGAGVELGATRTRWGHLREAMASHTKVMESSVAKMRVSLDGLIQKFLKDIQRFSHNWKQQKSQLLQAFTDKKKDTIKRLLDSLKDQVNDLGDLRVQADELTAKCDYFNAPKPNFALLEETARDVNYASTMWGLYDQFHEQLAALRAEDWLTFRSHTYQFDDFCKSWNEKLAEQQQQTSPVSTQEPEARGDAKQKDGKRSRARGSANKDDDAGASEGAGKNAIVQYLQRLLKDWARAAPLLKVVRGDGWMTEHWSELFRLLDIPKGMTSTELTFGHILDAYVQLLEKEMELKQLQARAQGEIQIREALQDLRTWALEATFTLVPPSALLGDNADASAPRVKLITEWKEVMADVSDNQALVNSLKDSPFYVHFADEAAGWESKLAALADSLVLLNSIQRKWAYLEPIFARGALPQEQARFKRVDKEFTGILREVEADPRVMSLASSVDLRDRLKTILEQIERCQKSLMEYLEAKRDKLPRFYFISDEDLLEILGHSQNPSVIQAHLKKLFMGIHSVVFNKEETAITHMVSADGEQVALLHEVAITEQNVEDWLIRLDEAMRQTLQELVVKCVAEADPSATLVVDRYPSQVLQVALQVQFARSVESAIAANTVSNTVLEAEKKRLERLTREDDAAAKPKAEDGSAELTELAASVRRLKKKALILDVIHNIEVAELLVSQNVRRVEDWNWQKQLRYTLDSQGAGQCRVHMTDTVFDYTYEYQGNAAKLVHTPLTDKCYLVLTKGMNLGYGGNPYGPAGTGKTESVKALGSAMGRQVLVFNCDEGIDFQAMGRIFVGIVKCGAWGCFDEFNRLKIDQLSAISQMIQVIQEALKMRELSCELLGKTVEVNANAGIFVTLNPAGKGYGGRTRLPDNLKQLFREVAMSVPDNSLITSTMLLSEGFAHARSHAKNVVELFRLCHQLLSPQEHYDWGLRPLKAVLRLGGTLVQRWRREHAGKAPSEQEEAELVLQSLNVNTLSKLTYDDARLFSGLLRDIFPGVASREVSYAELEVAVKSAAASLNLQVIPSQISKVLQLYESMNQRMGVVLVGPSGSGKSTLIRLLKAALEVMGVTVPLHVMNPKAMPRRQLLGYMDPDTREWYDGVLTSAARDAVKQPKESRPWILCDGDIDPEWVESLNSVLDDNKLLTMPNGVRIQFGNNVNFLFETHSLQYASPATVSRMGVIFFSEKDVHLEAVVESILVKQQTESRRGSLASGSFAALPSAGGGEPTSPHSAAKRMSEAKKAASAASGEATSEESQKQKQLVQWIMKYVFAAIDEATRADGSLSVPTTRMGLLKTCLNHVTGATNEADFIYSLIRGLGSTMQPEAHAKLALWLYETSGQKPVSKSRPLDTYFDRTANRVAEFVADLSGTVTPAALLSGHAPVIRTVEVQRLETTLAPLIEDAACKPFFLVGAEGCGKGALLKHCLSHTQAGGARTAIISCSAQTNSTQVIQKLEQLCVPFNTTTGRALRPKDGDRLVLVLKSVNLPKPDKYGTVELHSFLQQLVLYHGYYNSELDWVSLERVQIVATMNPGVSSGRHPVAPRLLAVVNVITIANPSRQSLTLIYSTYWSALLKATDIGQGRDFGNGAELAQMTISVYEKIRKRFEGEEYAHVLFSPRNLTSWVANALMYKVDAQTTLPAVLAYEASRLFADCLPKPEDRARAEKILTEQLATIGYSTPSKDDRYSTMFVTWFSALSGNDGGLLEDADGGTEREVTNADEPRGAAGLGSRSALSRLRLEQKNYKDVVKEVDNALLRYSREFKSLSIPLIPSVVSWITYVDRVLSRSGGHLVVVGRPGVGRRDAVVLAAFMQRMEVVSINSTQDYSVKNFRNDLRAVVQRAVQQDSQLVLVIEEHNIVSESFLELINSLVSSGEVPGLFTSEEMEMMYAPLREEAANEGFLGPIQAFFLRRLERNLHIALIMDNHHPLFLVRLQSNPGLLGRCELLWMGGWTAELTKLMCKTVLKDQIAALENNSAYKGFHLHRELLAVHESVADATPKDFEVLMKTYIQITEQKSKSSGADLQRLETGLAKLKEAEEKVENIKRDVGKKKTDVETMQKEADSALNKIQKSMQDSQEQRDEAAELQEQLKKEHDDIVAKRSKSEEELSTIKPLLEAARSAVSSIRSEQLSEIRSLKAPPEPIRDVLEGVLALLGVNDVSWNSMRSFLGERGAKERILDFDVQNITPAIRTKVSKLLQQKSSSFKPEVIHRASVAAAPMAEWVKAMIEYATITERIAPLTRQLEQLEQNQKEGEEKLDELKKKLKKIDKLVESLREEFASKCKEAERLRVKLEKAESELTKAQDLLEKLSGEKTRWARDAAAIQQSNQLMPLRAMISAAFMTYLPKYTEDVRQQYMSQWCGRLVPFIDNFSGDRDSKERQSAAQSMRLTGFLRTEGELLQYKSEGLPADELSQENAMVILSTIQTPLVIDPANQAVDWMKTHLHNQNVVVEVASLHDERFPHTLELAIRFGKTLLVTEVSSIDPILYSVLRKDLISAGAKRVVQVGSKSVDWQDSFRIVLFTRRTDLVLPPGAAALVTEVNFSVTSLGLQSQLLGITIQHEKPELETQKVELLRKEEGQKLELTKLESQLLQELADSQGNLMENAELVNSLNTVKTQAASIHEALAQSHALQKELDEKRNVYRPFAQTSARVFFLVKDLERLNRMYQFGLTDFIEMFSATLTKHGGGAGKEAASASQAKGAGADGAAEAGAGSTAEKVDKLAKDFVRTVFHRVSLGLLKADRVVFGLHLLHGCLPAGTFPEDQWGALVGAVRDVREDVTLPQWAPVESKVKYAAILSCSSGPALVEKWGLRTEDGRWSAWMQSADPEQALQKDFSPALPLMERLLIINAFRPDCMSVVCLSAILSRLGVDSLTPALSLESCVVDSAARTPVLLITSSGADPSVEVQEIAEQVVGKNRFTQVALGGGQTQEAMQQLRRCAANGDWIFLKNLHLVLDWASVLEKELCAMPDPSPDFRLIITTEPHDAFPSVLLRMSTKVTVEAPPGVKQNLLRTYGSSWDRAFLEAQSHEGAPMLFGLAWLHAVVQERRVFVPQGWVKFYEFSPADLKAASAIVVAQSTGKAAGKKSSGVDWATVKGFLQHCIYGGRLDNPHDEQVLKLLIDSYFTEEAIVRGKTPLYGGEKDAFTVPLTGNHDAVVAQLQQTLPDVDPPSMLRLPDNAGRAVQEGATAAQVEQLRALTQQSAASQTTSKEGWRAMLEPVLALWKGSGLGSLAGSSRGLASSQKDADPMEVFAISEVNMLTRLITDLASLFADLIALSEGTLMLSDALREDATELAGGRMPSRWLDRMQGPKEVKLWLALLSRKNAAAAALMKNPRALTDGAACDLTSLLRPDTFLNALRQHTARQSKTALVGLVLVATCAGSSDGIAASLQVRVKVAGASLFLQGAQMGGDGRLRATAANAPSSAPLPTDLVVGWVPGEQLRAKTRDGTTTIPVYASADRTTQLFPLTVPCDGGAAEATRLILSGVACFLMAA